jgi:broad specificity phosphatase PhoE
VKTVVHLLRHGEVENPTKILYGRLPGFRLSALGEEMAKAATAWLQARDITQVFSSPLERARQTAEPIAAQFDLAVQLDDRLIESSNYFEGQRVGVGDGALRDPRNWWALRNPFQPSWGEQYTTIAQRMQAMMRTVRDAAQGHEAVCVSHQLTIWTIRRLFERKRLWHDPRRRQCALASLTSFTFDGAELVSIGYTEPAAPLLARSPGARTAKGA